MKDCRSTGHFSRLLFALAVVSLGTTTTTSTTTNATSQLVSDGALWVCANLALDKYLATR